MAPQQSPQGPLGFMRQLSMALELPFVLLGGVLIGGAIGYWFDLKLHTAPWLLLAFGLLGFAAGMRELLRRLSASGDTGASNEKQNDKR